MAQLQLLRPAEVAALIGIHRVTLHTWVRKGRFPAPFKVGQQRQPIPGIRRGRLDRRPRIRRVRRRGVAPQKSETRPACADVGGSRHSPK